MRIKVFKFFDDDVLYRFSSNFNLHNSDLHINIDEKIDFISTENRNNFAHFETSVNSCFGGHIL